MSVELDSANALVTLQAAKEWARIRESDPTNNDVLSRLINSVSVKFNEYTGRKLKARDLTEYYDAQTNDDLYVDNPPINTVTSIHLDPDREYGDDTLTTDYITYGSAGLIALTKGHFPKTRQAIKIVYNGGYSEIPADLEVACLDQIKFLYTRWFRNEEAIDSVTMDAGTVQIKKVDDLLPSVRAILDKYRLLNG